MKNIKLYFLITIDISRKRNLVLLLSLIPLFFYSIPLTLWKQYKHLHGLKTWKLCSPLAYFMKTFLLQKTDIYQQLYFDRNITAFIIVTYHSFGHVLLAGDTIGSNMPGRHSKSSAVIMAYWPSRGQNLGSIDYSTMQVGTVQFYCISGSSRYNEEVMLLACIKWKKLHTHFDWFGSSAIVCENIDEFESTKCSKVCLYYHAS